MLTSITCFFGLSSWAPVKISSFNFPSRISLELKKQNQTAGFFREDLPLRLRGGNPENVFTPHISPFFSRMSCLLFEKLIGITDIRLLNYQADNQFLLPIRLHLTGERREREREREMKSFSIDLLAGLGCYIRYFLHLGPTVYTTPHPTPRTLHLHQNYGEKGSRFRFLLNKVT